MNVGSEGGGEGWFRGGGSAYRGCVQPRAGCYIYVADQSPMTPIGLPNVPPAFNISGVARMPILLALIDVA